MIFERLREMSRTTRAKKVHILMKYRIDNVKADNIFFSMAKAKEAMDN